MKLKILASASQDLLDGYRFYEKQTEGLGTYFLDTLFSDQVTFRFKQVKMPELLLKN
ncbi:hypothetical protein BMS3Abin06_02823 [bacterium BMS3Abin06]|nr:hypothetical protein BMS3Abin06_02823 [bacterium BMS3Abin06]